jgi:hypothetical protein
MTQKLPDNTNNVRVRFTDGTDGIGYYNGNWCVFSPQDEAWAEENICEDAPEDILNRVYAANTTVSAWSIIQNIYIPADLWNVCTRYVDTESCHSIDEINALIALLESAQTERGNLLADELASWKENEP